MASDVLTEQGELREELATPAFRADRLEQPLALESLNGLSMSGVAAWIPDVRRITQELFPGSFTCSDEFDPEFPADTYVVVNVESTGDAQEVVRRRCRWHERIRALSADLFGKVRLSITPR